MTYTLPLFSLNTVLFPGVPISLHVFEPRYRLMVQHCIDTGSPFGVVLIRRGREVGDSAVEPAQVGTTARLTEVQKLSDGRMNITAVGEDRFRIRRLNWELPYLVGEVESLPLEHPCSIEVSRGARRLRPWVRQYLRLVSLADPEPDPDLDLSTLELPEDPLAMLYFANALLQVPAVEKQPLLEAPGAPDLLAASARLFRREVALLARLVTLPQDAPRRAAWLN